MNRFHLAQIFLRPIQLLTSRLVVEGAENIPDQGPYLVVANHMSSADTPFILLAFPPMEWRIFAGEKWEQHWFFGPLMAQLGAIFINRGVVDRRALRLAVDTLNKGGVFALAPEGTRSKVGSMMQAKDGAAFLASHAGVKLLPIGMNNSDAYFAGIKKLRPETVVVRIGQPFELPDLGHRARGRELSAYTELIMAHIAQLVEPRHRGFYAESPALAALEAGEDPWLALSELADKSAADD